MSRMASGETHHVRKIPYSPAGRLADMIEAPAARQAVRKKMPTGSIKSGYAFTDTTRDVALQKLLKRISREVSNKRAVIDSDSSDNGTCEVD